MIVSKWHTFCALMLFATAQRECTWLLHCLKWSLGQACVYQFVPQLHNGEVSIQSMSNACHNKLGTAQRSNYIECSSALKWLSCTMQNEGTYRKVIRGEALRGNEGLNFLQRRQWDCSLHLHPLGLIPDVVQQARVASHVVCEWALKIICAA